MANLFDVADCLLWLDDQSDGEGISNLKLQKLVYYTQGFYSALYDKYLFDDEIHAWMHGPVVPELYQKYKSNGKTPILANRDFDTSVFDKDQLDLMYEVFQELGQYSAWKLRDMTHEEPPWMNNKDGPGLIPKEEITEYFKTRIN